VGWGISLDWGAGRTGDHNDCQEEMGSGVDEAGLGCDNRRKGWFAGISPTPSPWRNSDVSWVQGPWKEVAEGS
jgi:hypothetical protein